MNRKTLCIRIHNNRWAILAAGIIIFTSLGLEAAASDETVLSGELFSSTLRNPASLTVDLNHQANKSIPGKGVEDEKNTNGLLMDANIRPETYDPGLSGQIWTAIGSPTTPKTLSIIGPLFPDAGRSSTQPIMGILWNQETKQRGKWNIVLCLGGFNNSSDGILPFAITEQISVSENNDIADKIRDVIQVIGFEIRFDF